MFRADFRSRTGLRGPARAHCSPTEASEMKRAKTHDTEDRTHSADPEAGAPEHGDGRPVAEGADGQPAEAGAAQPVTPEQAPREEQPSREAQEMREKYLRLAAEYDNYRKRVERERAEAWNRAQAQVVERLLDVLDDLQRIADFTPETATAGALLEGAQMVERKLVRALEAAGVEPVDAEGQPFDPSVHEALMTVPAGSREEDHTVASVFQKGYRFKGTLLRPARVQVKRFEG